MLIRPEELKRAVERVMTKDMRDRFVIDMASLKRNAREGHGRKAL